MSLCRDALYSECPSWKDSTVHTYIHTGQLYMEDGIEVEKDDDEKCIMEDGTGTGTGKYIR